MRKVLHVGPLEAQGGISKVMQILAAYPPDGWSSTVLNTASSKGIFTKLVTWFRAKKEIQTIHADLVHIHSAANWSFRRKLSLAKKVQCPVVFHIHSGNFKVEAKKNLNRYHLVTLTEGWAERLEPLIGPSTVISNPVDPLIKPGTNRGEFILLLGRPDKVKGHDFAFTLGLPNLIVTGREQAPSDITALGWVSEERKRELLETAKALIVPSEFEGQPLVILEALAANCPVVASDSIIDLPESVVVAKHQQKQSWLDALSNLKTEGLVKSVEKHQINSIRKQWGRFYEEIIDNK